jgi:hypothetical protein
MNWINQHFDGFATIFSAIFLIILYKFQLILKRKENEQSGARIVLLEIYHAESMVKNIKETEQITHYQQILPTNSWQKFQHLFIKKLSQSELELITNLFNYCDVAEKQRRLFLSFIEISHIEKTKLTQQALLSLAVQYPDVDDKQKSAEYKIKSDTILKRFFDERNNFQPFLPKDQFFKSLSLISNISGTTAEKKLIEIAKLK